MSAFTMTDVLAINAQRNLGRGQPEERHGCCYQIYTRLSGSTLLDKKPCQMFRLRQSTANDHAFGNLANKTCNTSYEIVCTDNNNVRVLLTDYAKRPHMIYIESLTYLLHGIRP